MLTNKQKNLVLKIFSVFFIGIIFVFIFIAYERFIFSFNFTDEGDNISIGKYLLQGKKLYQDVFSQHQPLTYYFSSLIQKISQPANILMAIKRHREAVMFFSFAWIAVLIWRFGYKLIFPAVFLELTKYYLLGHLFLAESLVGYPFVFLFLLGWQALKNKKTALFDNFIGSLAVFWIVFNLLPVAPAAGLLWLIILFKTKEKAKRLALIFPLAIAVIVLFFIVPLYFYFEDAIWANIFYYIPNANAIAFKVYEPLWFQLFKIPFYPLLSFFNLKDSFFQTFAVLSLVFLIASFVFIKKAKKKKQFWLFFLILSLANLRPPLDKGIFYQSFHSLPYFSLLVFFVFQLLFYLWQSETKKSLVFLLFFALFLALFFNKGMFYWQKPNKTTMQYIEFSRLFDSSIAFKIMAKPDDTLAVIPYEEMIYWLPNVQPATRFLFYQAWVYDVPKFKKEINQALKKQPPDFVYWQNTCLKPFLKTEDYVNLPRDSTVSGIFIHKNKLKEITSQQWQTLKYYRYNQVNNKK